MIAGLLKLSQEIEQKMLNCSSQDRTQARRHKRIQRYGRYAIDKVCLPSDNGFPVNNVARMGGSPRGTSTHFRHTRTQVRTEISDTKRHRSPTPRTLEPGRRTRYLTLGYSFSLSDKEVDLGLAPRECDPPGATAHICSMAGS